MPGGHVDLPVALDPLRITFRNEMSFPVLVSCKTWSGLAITSM